RQNGSEPLAKENLHTIEFHGASPDEVQRSPRTATLPIQPPRGLRRRLHETITRNHCSRTMEQILGKTYRRVQQHGTFSWRFPATDKLAS
ncbi:MAG TPA: hypothetical protein PKI05_12225, partial [Thermogutta sp.]|nr:hypothetical protein [Thermogutta sp.]